MIRQMPLPRALCTLLLATVIGCGGSSKTSANEPKNAKEKQIADAKASGELDGTNKKWGTWRYSGERDDCFYVVGRRCFKSKANACKAVGCKAGKKCNVVGGGPATVSCK